MVRVFEQIAASLNIIKMVNYKASQLYSKHEQILDEMSDLLPSGSGVDGGTKIDESSTPEKIVLTFSYHFMNEYGMYDGWANYQATVTASMRHIIDIDIEVIEGQELHDQYAPDNYLDELFYDALIAEIPQDKLG